MLVLGKIRDFLNLEKKKNIKFQIKKTRPKLTSYQKLNKTKFVELTFILGHDNKNLKQKNCEKQFYCFLASFQSKKSQIPYLALTEKKRAAGPLKC